MCLTPAGLRCVSGMSADQLWPDYGETPTVTGVWETAMFVLPDRDLRLPLETVPTLPWRQLQGNHSIML